MGERSDDLLNELEESIPQGVPNATRPAPVDDFADLESLLQDSMKDKREREQYQKDREMARKGYAGLSKEEVEYCNSRMRAFELAREWDVAEAIVVFQQFYCPHCDKARTIFSRFMERHQHRFVKSTSRWLKRSGRCWKTARSPCAWTAWKNSVTRRCRKTLPG
jgi:thiol-disulfide isomerase/thioredoxin